MSELGCWVPPTTAGCLQPSAVAAQILNLVNTSSIDVRGPVEAATAVDITELNIDSPPEAP